MKSKKTILVAAGAIFILVLLAFVLTRPKLQSIGILYEGDTQEGTVLDEQNPGIKVIAHYSNDDKKEIPNGEWTIEEPKTLKADSSETIIVSYKGLSSDYKVKCSTTKLKSISVTYNGPIFYGTIINEDSDITVIGKYGNGSTEKLFNWNISPSEITLQKGEKVEFEISVDGENNNTLVETVSVQASYRTTDKPIKLEDSWEDIIAASNDGTYRDRYVIGDTKELDLGEEGLVTMKLVGLDADELADEDGHAPMTWISEQILNTEHEMNSSKTNAGGWRKSELRDYLKTTVLPLIPSPVQKNIKKVVKYNFEYTNNPLNPHKTTTTQDKLWIPSVREMHGTSHPSEDSGPMYTSTIERKHIGKDQAATWWLRSAWLYNDRDFSCAHDEIYIHECQANFPQGIVIGFCL